MVDTGRYQGIRVDGPELRPRISSGYRGMRVDGPDLLLRGDQRRSVSNPLTPIPDTRAKPHPGEAVAAAPPTRHPINVRFSLETGRAILVPAQLAII